jgi:hypothetical protein
MTSIPARWPAAVTCMLVLLTLGANSCGDHHEAEERGKKGRTKIKQISCDSEKRHIYLECERPHVHRCV